ncbi:type II toxin-antitoxin system VapC family toxin [Sphingomonas sp.]|uniref:type II toxin-antitoxin system VapC family toxin n=1 Tax=Sphingomonas sp. TaxID=28214 RepID=UPI002DBF5F65|nr:type II toxin-antitoxin system VapC family toxin [Sphingomonas sp.]HEU4967576.1 type II toxin-antitoxin system VapC family toxin [Sphingomonas sp.]
MTRFLLDTNIISTLIRDPDGDAAEAIWARSDECCTSIVVAAELRFGLAKNPSAHRQKLLEAVLESIDAAPWESPADLHYGELRAALERAGTPIGSNDMLIAAHALALNCTLVTANEREFRRVPGLAVENWTA